ncbi:MAG TPA: four helix bundle protein, partial [Cytophagaceae bacterium]
AVESLSSKDYAFKIKVCRKEAKEAIYWLDSLLVEDIELEKEKELLRKEALELMKIFGSIVTKLNKFQG